MQADLPCPGYDHTNPRSKRGPVKRFRIIQGVQNVALAPALREDVTPPPPPLPPALLPPSLVLLPPAPAFLPLRLQSTPDREQTAIDFFLTQTLRVLATYVPGTHLWTSKTFTLLLEDPKVRNIAIAIGLAHQDMLENVKRGLGPYTSVEQATRSGNASPSDAMVADRYYNTSLAFMRVDVSTINENSPSERTGVALACLLFVIYLSFQSRMEEAAVHMTCGLEVVNEGAGAFLAESLVNQEIYTTFLHFSTASWAAHPSALLFSIMQATVKLSVHLTNQTPLAALRTDIDLCAQRIYSYTHHVTRGIFPDLPTQVQARDALVADIDSLLDKVEAYATSVRASTPPAMDNMNDAFVPAMKARLLVYRIFMLCVSTRYQTTYDRYYKVFDDALVLTWQALQRGTAILGSTDWPLLSIHFNVVGMLRHINLLCRHPTIRRRSINMLTYLPQREGILDIGEGYQLANIAMTFEEAGLDLKLDSKHTPIIPEENRLHFVESIRRGNLQGVILAEDEIMVRLMFRPDGDSSYVERRVRCKKEHLRCQKVIGF